VIEGEGAEAYSIEILSDSEICRVSVIDIAHDDPTEVLESRFIGPAIEY
jgi:hypothetical protein